MMLLKDLVEASERVGSTTGKKEKTFLLADFLKQARGREIVLTASYLSGQIPQGRMGIGWATLQEALQGLQEKVRPVSLLEADQSFEQISAEKGSGSLGRKLQHLRHLFSSTDIKGRDFLIRLVTGEIRQGALEGLLLEALAGASSLPLGRLRQAMMFSGDIGEIAGVIMEEGLSGLSRFQPRIFHPISPMLANPAAGGAEALARLGEAGWEFKIDGARVQVHKEGDEVRVFTRHLKEVTERLPEIVGLTRRLPIKKAIFEGEAIAMDQGGRPLPFQQTMRRFGRIHEVGEMRKEFPLTPYFFDLLYLDGDPLFDTPYRERFSLLAQKIPAEYRIPQIVTADEESVEQFLQKSLEAGHEGLVGKGIDSPYLAGQRGFFWLKIKTAQTLDLVVLAAEWGHGRRRGWLSNLHLGARDPESGQWVMLGKTFKGLTDEMLRWQTEKLLQLEVTRDEWTVYVKPEMVVEIAFNDLQESPRYPGGLALRFARVRRYRKEKPALEADTIQKVRALFESRI